VFSLCNNIEILVHHPPINTRESHSEIMIVITSVEMFTETAN